MFDCEIEIFSEYVSSTAARKAIAEKIASACWDAIFRKWREKVKVELYNTEANEDSRYFAKLCREGSYSGIE